MACPHLHSATSALCLFIYIQYKTEKRGFQLLSRVRKNTSRNSGDLVSCPQELNHMPISGPPGQGGHDLLASALPHRGGVRWGKSLTGAGTLAVQSFWLTPSLSFPSTQIPARRDVRGGMRCVARPHRSKFVTLLILDMTYSSQSAR